MSFLQFTFSIPNLGHARYVYDQIHIISRLFLAVTAGSSFYKGKVANWDVNCKVL
jgi:hypothetical protein